MYLESTRKPKKHIKRVFFLIIFLCLSITSLTIYLIIDKINYDNVLNSTVIAERLSKISELSTLKYNYSNILAVKNNIKFNNYTIPFTEKSFLIRYSGYIKAGVDLKDLEVIVNKKQVFITLKKSKILDHVINKDDLFVYDEKSSMFNKLSMQDMVSEINTEQTKIEASLVKTGFLDTANSNTKLLLEGILSDMGFENITIIYK